MPRLSAAVAHQHLSPQRITRPLFALLSFAALSHTLISPELRQSLAAFAAVH